MRISYTNVQGRGEGITIGGCHLPTSWHNNMPFVSHFSYEITKEFTRSSLYSTSVNNIHNKLDKRVPELTGLRSLFKYFIMY